MHTVAPALQTDFSSTTAAVGIRTVSYLLVQYMHASLIFFAVRDIRRPLCCCWHFVDGWN